MKKRIACIIQFFYFILSVAAQTGGVANKEFKATTVRDYRPSSSKITNETRSSLNDGYDQLLKNKTPLSPQAEGIEKHANYSIDYSTGVPNISIPLYEIKVGNVTLPISINYHASGIKVQDMATPVGLGWTLNAGGAVNRQVRGNTDYITNNTLDLDYSSEAEVDYDMYHNSIMSNYMWHRVALKADGDTESDRYTYSFNGKSGVFRYCVTDHSLRTIPYSGIKIENIPTGGYKIIDTDGTKYYFQKGETNTDNNSSTLQAITTWYITKIEPANSKNVIEFTYESGKGYTMSYITQIYNTGRSYELESGMYEHYNLTENMYYSDSFQSYSGSYHGIVLLKQISWAGNTITFNYQQDRKEQNLGLDRLTSVVVKNSQNTVVRNIVFDNDYYMGTNKNNFRMLLRGLSIYGSSSTEALNYSFSYDSRELPNYFKVGTDMLCHEDYWGYYNGSYTQSWIPWSEYTNGNVNNNRTPSIDMLIGTLKSITYPTGGITEIEMEPNVADNNRKWGGLRIKKQINKDADGTVITTKTYQYSGPYIAQDITSDIYNYDVEYFYGYRDTGGLQCHTGIHTINSSTPFLPLTGDMGFPIFYSHVTETIEGIGKVEYGFTENRSSLNNMEDNSHYNDPLHLYSTQYNFDQGNICPTLSSKKIFALENGQYKLKTAESYTYSEIPKDTFRLGVRFEQSNVLINYGGIHDHDGTYDVTDFHYEFCYSDVWAVPSFFVLTSKSITDYDGKVTTTTSYGYDPQYRTLEPTSETTIVSNGETLTTLYTYPFQKTGTVYANMANANIQVPVETKTLRAGTTINRTKTTYANYNGLYLPSAYYVGKTDSEPTQRVVYDYDAKGNLTYLEKDSIQKTVFLWGYNGLYPVAKIDGMSKTSVYGALGTAINTLLGSPSDANIYAVNSNSTIANEGLATTYTWTPQIGIASIRKPNLETTYYTYDIMGRLASIKNHYGKVIESYIYNYGGTASTNYVRSRTMRDANGYTFMDVFDYYDGQGRKSETVCKGLSPNGSDLVTLMEYDACDRIIKEWLPTTFSNTGNYIQPSTYKTVARPYYSNDSKPFSLTEYETCHTDKILKRYGPGVAWQDNGKAVETRYTGNDADDVKIFTVSNDGNSLTGSGTYDANQLFVIESKDENGNYSYTFTDKEGRLVLERRKAGSVKYDTYYVYDIYGNLSVVLPPAASNAFSTGTWDIASNAAIKNYAYYYKYDERNRCIEKKLPGSEKITMTYDSADRLITVQNGVQRNSAGLAKKYFKYDSFSRPIEIGIKTNTGSEMPLQQNYYDNYSFVNQTGLNVNTSAGADAAFPSNGEPNARGLLTGTKIYQEIGLSLISYTSFYYGEQGRLVQSHRQNHLGGYEDEYYTYNFTGQVLTKKHIHYARARTTQTEVYSNTYDNGGRLTNVTYKLNDNSAINLSSCTYDDVARLYSKSIMESETVTYSYNIRNWPTGINSTNFQESLSYNVANGSLAPTVANWNGNISAISWKAGGETANRAYQFRYNALDWLTSANYSGTGNYDTEYTYDKMGNLQTLMRYGKDDDSTFGLLDNLICNYIGNQVVNIRDSENDPTYTGAFNFVDGAKGSSIEYTYDANGNMTRDLNKHISSIQYNNFLNLPMLIGYSDGRRTEYYYDAAGRKLRAKYWVAPTAPTAPIDYCGNMIYENYVLKKILIDGGYITFNDTIPEYHYYLKDHLGNNRVVVNIDGTVEQVNHYYPFGGLFGDSTGGSVQWYKYNGKEFDRTHGLDWYDYGARHMAPDIGKFTTIDPLAEKYYSISPYVYCKNNPVKHFDPDGREVRDGLGGYNEANKNSKNLVKYLAKHNDPNSIMIVAHGVIEEGENFASSINIQTYNPKTKEWNDNYISNGKEFSKFLSGHSKTWNNYKKGNIDADDLHIVFYSCSSSEVTRKISADSEFKDITFIAPNKDVSVTANSEVIVADMVMNSNGKYVINNNSDDIFGEWITFKNGRQPRFNSQYQGDKNLKPGIEKFSYNFTFF